MKGFEPSAYWLRDGDYTISIVCFGTYWEIQRRLNTLSIAEYLCPGGEWKTWSNSANRLLFFSAEEASEWFWRNVMGEKPEETPERAINV